MIRTSKKHQKQKYGLGRAITSLTTDLINQPNIHHDKRKRRLRIPLMSFLFLMILLLSSTNNNLQAENSALVSGRVLVSESGVSIPDIGGIDLDAHATFDYMPGHTTPPNSDLRFFTYNQGLETLNGGQVAQWTATASGLNGCSTQTYSSPSWFAIPLNGYLCTITGDDRYAEIEIIYYDPANVNGGDDLVIAYTTWDLVPTPPAPPSPPAAPTLSSSPSFPQCMNQVGNLAVSECNTLAHFYQNNGGTGWTSDINWLNWSVSPCDWQGVTCDGGGVSVRYLSLNNNNVTGTLLPELANLSNLNQLRLVGNSLTGGIPAAYGHLSNLSLLYLGSNSLTGTLPAALGNLNLSQIQIDGNQLTGSLPPALGNLGSLGILSASNNQFTGVIPPELGNTNLNTLYLANNQMSGVIPAELGNLPLINVQLQNNEFSGELSAALATPSLNLLYAQENQLSGVIPSGLGSTALTQLLLSGNRFSSSLPASLGSLNLSNFNVAANALEGDVPSTYANLTNITTACNVGFNKLTIKLGTVQSWLESECDSVERALRQTVPPINVQADSVASGAVRVSWSRLSYIGNGGRYQLLYKPESNDDHISQFTIFASTPDKATTELTINNLDPNIVYEFAVRTLTPAHPGQPNDLISDLSLVVASSANVGLEAVIDAQTGGSYNVVIEDGVPVTVITEIPLDLSIDNPVGQTLNYLDQLSALYQIEDVQKDLYLDRFVENPEYDTTHTTFGQRWQGIPVFASQLAVHTQHDNVVFTSGGYLVDIPDFPEPNITSREAETAALNELDNPTATVIGATIENIFAPHLIGGSGWQSYRTWRVITVSEGGEHLASFVDVLSGEIIDQVSMSETHAGPGELDLDLDNAGARSSSRCYSDSTTWFTEDGATESYSANADSLNDGTLAYGFIQDTYDYYLDTFGRDSWDNNNGQVNLVVDIWDWGNNAAHFGSCGLLGFSNGWVTDDVVIHEFAHRVDAFSGGLIYRNQSGALDESFADVFGAFFTGDWLVGEDIPLNLGNAQGALRNMANPPALTFTPQGGSATAYPDHFSQLFTGSWDNGGVHINSSIPNKVAYLLTDGDTHKGIAVAGMGIAKAQQLYYDVHTTGLTSNASFGAARGAMEAQILSYLDSANPLGFTFNDVCMVQDAWASVGVGNPNLTCALTGLFGGDTDGDFVPSVSDNCDFVQNVAQRDTDGDGEGDACDADDDNDGILDVATVSNPADNCQLIPNPDQADGDNDGLGDACDLNDTDGDGLLDHEDNCPVDFNPWQTDFDLDGDGDVCDIDDDGDSSPDFADNCQYQFNPSQADSDGDGVGNSCDNCTTTHNPDQVDTDEDGIGDSCDSDIDDDGVPNGADNCPSDFDPYQIDLDNDGIGTACDSNEAILTGYTPLPGLIFPIGGEPLPIPLPVPGPHCPVCGDDLDLWPVLQPGFDIQVDFGSTPTAIQVVDALGNVVLSQSPALAHDFTFLPEPESNFFEVPFGSLRRGAGATPEAYSINGYQLRFVPPAGSEGQPVDVAVSINRAPTSVELAQTDSAELETDGQLVVIMTLVLVMMSGMAYMKKRSSK